LPTRLPGWLLFLMKMRMKKMRKRYEAGLTFPRARLVVDTGHVATAS